MNVLDHVNTIEHAIEFLKKLIENINKESMTGTEYRDLEDLCNGDSNEIENLENLIDDDVLYGIRYDDYVFPCHIYDPNGKEIYKGENGISYYDIEDEPNLEQYTITMWDSKKEPLIKHLQFFIKYLERKLKPIVKNDSSIIILRTYMGGETADGWDPDDEELDLYKNRIIPALYKMNLVGENMPDNINLDKWDSKTMKAIDEDADIHEWDIVRKNYVAVNSITPYVDTFKMLIFNEDVLDMKQIYQLKRYIFMDIPGEECFIEYTYDEFLKEISTGNVKFFK